jgi:hypothetical protein
MERGTGFTFVLLKQSEVLDFTVNNSNPPRSGIPVFPHPAAGAMVTTSEDSQIYIGFGAQIDAATTIDHDNIEVYVLKDGRTTKLVATSWFDAANNRVIFNGEVPANSKVTWNVVKLKDSEGNLLVSQSTFTRAMSSLLGGTVEFGDATDEQGHFKLTIPANSLPEDALVVIDTQTVSQAVDAATQRSKAVHPDMQRVGGPFHTYGITASKTIIHDLLKPATLLYDRNIMAASEQSQVIQIEGLDGQIWRPLGTSDRISVGAQSKSIGSRSVTVYTSRLGTFQATSLAIPGPGVTEFFNFPNPFSPAEGGTNLQYLLGEDSDITIVIYDLFGNLVRKLNYSAGVAPEAKYPLGLAVWDGLNGEGVPVANGGYIVKIFATGVSGTKTSQTHKVGVVK